MWKLLFFVILNGQPTLGYFDTNSLQDCNAKAAALVAEATAKEIPMAVRCVEFKVS